MGVQIERILDGEPRSYVTQSGHEIVASSYSIISLLVLAIALLDLYAGALFLFSPLHAAVFSQAFANLLAFANVTVLLISYISVEVKKAFARPIPSIDQLEDDMHDRIDQEEY